MNMKDKGRKGRVPRGKREPAPALAHVHARLFAEDVETLMKIAAEKGLPWQIELRLTVRRALKAGVQEVTVLKEAP